MLEGSASPSEQIRGRWHPHPQRRGDSPSRRPQFNPPRWASSSWSGLQVLCDAKALACQSKRLGRGRSLPSGGAGAPDQQERAQHQELNRKRRDGEPPRRPPRQTRRNATGKARRQAARDTKKRLGGHLGPPTFERFLPAQSQRREQSEIRDQRFPKHKVLIHQRSEI